MTLESTLLPKLARWRSPEGEQQTLTDGADGWAVTVAADCADTVGCRVWEVRVSRTAPLTGAADLKARAERVSGLVTGLLEPLALVEVDAQGNTAQLRSAAPKPVGDAVHYYEVLLEANGSAAVRRYEAARAGKRQQINFTLTHEAIAKLADDLAV